MEMDLYFTENRNSLRSNDVKISETQSHFSSVEVVLNDNAYFFDCEKTRYASFDVTVVDGNFLLRHNESSI